MLDVLMLDQPEQLKALGHPLRLRILETLGTSDDAGDALTNRELAERLGVDPGHLHFHVRMLLRAGLIALAEDGGRGREKPYRAGRPHAAGRAGAARVGPDERPARGDARARCSTAGPSTARKGRSARLR